MYISIAPLIVVVLAGVHWYVIRNRAIAIYNGWVGSVDLVTTHHCKIKRTMGGFTLWCAPS